jgi:3-hydroxyisobutyrate dehydrogenase-like beta-hydroxyacid dehydrogenase
MQRIAIIGVGLLGSAVASRLLQGGFQVTGYDTRPEQVQALRAARNAGIKVDSQTIDKAVDYINKSTDANGQTR